MTFQAQAVVAVPWSEWTATMQLRAKTRKHGQEIEQLWVSRSGAQEWRPIPIVDRNGNPIAEE